MCLWWLCGCVCAMDALFDSVDDRKILLSKSYLSFWNSAILLLKGVLWLVAKPFSNFELLMWIINQLNKITKKFWLVNSRGDQPLLRGGPCLRYLSHWCVPVPKLEWIRFYNENKLRLMEYFAEFFVASVWGWNCMCSRTTLGAKKSWAFGKEFPKIPPISRFGRASSFNLRLIHFSVLNNSFQLKSLMYWTLYFTAHVSCYCLRLPLWKTHIRSETTITEH